MMTVNERMEFATAQASILEEKLQEKASNKEITKIAGEILDALKDIPLMEGGDEEEVNRLKSRARELLFRSCYRLAMEKRKNQKSKETKSEEKRWTGIKGRFGYFGGKEFLLE